MLCILCVFNAGLLMLGNDTHCDEKNMLVLDFTAEKVNSVENWTHKWSFEERDFSTMPECWCQFSAACVIIFIAVERFRYEQFTSLLT